MPYPDTERIQEIRSRQVSAVVGGIVSAYCIYGYNIAPIGSSIKAGAFLGAFVGLAAVAAPIANELQERSSARRLISETEIYLKEYSFYKEE